MNRIIIWLENAEKTPQIKQPLWRETVNFSGPSGSQTWNAKTPFLFPDAGLLRDSSIFCFYFIFHSLVQFIIIAMCSETENVCATQSNHPTRVQSHTSKRVEWLQWIIVDTLLQQHADSRQHLASINSQVPANIKSDHELRRFASRLLTYVTLMPGVLAVQRVWG